VRVLRKGPMALSIAGTVTIVAVTGKFLAATVTSLIAKYSNNDRNLIFGLSNAHAAATLAIIMVGYEREIIDENVLNGTIVLILITCIIASLVTENASRRIVMAGHQYDANMEHGPEHEERLLLTF